MAKFCGRWSFPCLKDKRSVIDFFRCGQKVMGISDIYTAKHCFDHPLLSTGPTVGVYNLVGLHPVGKHIFSTEKCYIVKCRCDTNVIYREYGGKLEEEDATGLIDAINDAQKFLEKCDIMVVCCFAGVLRSTSVVAGLMYINTKANLNECICEIYQHRKRAKLSPKYRAALNTLSL